MDDKQKEQRENEAWIVRRLDGEELGVILSDELEDALRRPGVRQTLADARRMLAEEERD